MRDHLPGFPSVAAAVADVLSDDPWAHGFPNAYPLGVPKRVRWQAGAAPLDDWMAERMQRKALRAFEAGNHPNPDGTVDPTPMFRVVTVGWAGAGRLTVTREQVKECAAACLGVTFHARTPEQAADRIGEAFAHIAAAKGNPA